MLINEISIHYSSDMFKKKLNQIMIKKGLINKRGNADPVKLYNLMYPNCQITEDMLKRDRPKCMELVRKESNWIRGCNYPKSIEDILLLCNALNCDLDYFFTDMEAPTHDLQFISDKMNLPMPVIERLIDYDKNIKHILSNLVYCEEKKSPDLLFYLLINISYYAMGTNVTKIVLKDTLSDTDEEINNSEVINEMLKHSSIQALNICLDHSASVMEDKKNRIRDLKIEYMKSEINRLKQEMADNTGKSM